MRPWAPLSLTRTGAPITGQIPVRTVVHGGQLSPHQSAMLQNVFTGFMDMARQSVGTNPSAQGLLPDGSRYTINCVGGACTCAVWPDGSDSWQRGIGLSGGQGAALFVIAYRKNKWAVKTAQQFFGGGDVWVSADYKTYFTDSGHGPKATGVRGYSVRGPVPQARPADATVLVGVQYEGAVAAELLSRVISPAKKYVVVGAPDERTFIMHDVDVVPEALAKISPDVPAATAEYRTTLSLPAPAHPLERGIPPYRLRTGAEVGFPVALRGSSVPPWMGENTPGIPERCSLFHLMGAAVVTCAEDGEYSASFVSGGVEFHDDTDSGTFRAWTPRTYTYKQDETAAAASYAPSSIYSMTPPAGNYNPYGYCGNPPMPVGSPTVRAYSIISSESTRRADAELHGTAERLVYLGRGWNDEEVKFTVSKKTDVHHGRHTDSRGYRAADIDLGDEYRLAVGGLDARRLSAAANAGWPIPGYPPTPAGTFREEIFEEEKVSTEIDTPWGKIKQKDVDLRFARLTRTNGPGQGDWLYTGKYLCATVTHIDPLLGVVAYIEASATEFTVVPDPAFQLDTRSRVEATLTTKLVVLCRGKEVFRKTVGTGTTPLQYKYLPDVTVSSYDQTSYDFWVTALPVPYLATEFEDMFGCIENTPYGPAQRSKTVVTHVGFTGLAHEVHRRETREDNYPGNYTPSYFCPHEDAAKYEVSTAVDPNSGAGVVMIKYEGVVLEAMTVTPTGTKGSLLSILPSGTALDPALLSV